MTHSALRRRIARCARLAALLAPLACAGSAAAVPPLGVTVSLPAGSDLRRDVSSAPLDPQSAAMIAWLAGAGGWGTGALRIDFSIEVLRADASTPFYPFTPTADHYDPDCDVDPVPVPSGGALEGESGYACASDGDCHLIVWHEPTHRLFEMWRAHLPAGPGGSFLGGCLAVWSTQHTYGPAGRGEQCTSADAAGLPIAPLLFSADEVAAGRIDHAIRFILPNARIRNRTYVHPGTHATGAASGGASAPPYGARLRLRADYPLASLPNEGARVVARAMQRYGVILADGGNIALTAQSDRFTPAKWSGLLGSYDLAALRVSDFQWVDAGPRFAWSGDCRRAPGPTGRPTLVP
jgi:serine/threonine-protein kinase